MGDAPTVAALPAHGLQLEELLALAAWEPRTPMPIRLGMGGPEALESEAHSLASYCREAATHPQEGALPKRLVQNAHVLAEAHERILEATRRREPLTPDAEWLLDNYYVIDEVLQEVRHDLPRGYYRELPRLARDRLAGHPRVYLLALTLIGHTDSCLEESTITRFVRMFQTVTPLTIGELWALPTMLRVGLIENLRRLAEQMLRTWDEHEYADTWAQQFANDGAAAPPLPEPASDAFLVRILGALRTAGQTEARERVERQCAQNGIDLEAIIRRENQRQAINQVMVGNCVTSLRLLSALDWGDFFERTNPVEPILHEDPAGIYERQDFATRDRCRKAVERLARGARCTEVEVARQAVALAHAVATNSPRNHVGYYLIGPGEDLLRARLGYRPRLGQRVRDAILQHPHAAYFGSIALLGTGGLAVLATLALGANHTAPIWAWGLLFFTAILPFSELAVGIANYFWTLVLPPRVLPKLELKEGIPEDCATFIVMPSMLVRPQSASTLRDRLEIHYLANPDKNLYFALLTDFADAPTEHRPEDDGYLHDALKGIESLNRKYAGNGPSRFFLFHRRRQWNPSENCWMGWERKRGKLSEFNRLIRGDRNTSYTTISGDPSKLPNVRYVITLDLDTQLPRDVVRRMVGTMAHPLNRPQYDPTQRRVISGYSILQPRIQFQLAAASHSWFSRLWVASAGVDPYITAVSDIYQDLFGAGTFTGKGIYDVDAFEAATGKAFPVNHILSHDLIEADFARCGLATDIELFDDFPARYHAYARREHRWVRGDWQLLPWLGAQVPVSSGPGTGDIPAPPGRAPNPLPVLERWKVLDNLRRSLLPPALIVWLVLGWTALPFPAWLTTSVAVIVVFLPLLLPIVGAVLSLLRSGSISGMRDLRYSLPATFGQVCLSLSFLLYQAISCVDAIVRTLHRLFLTHRHLLEWETSASTERRLGASFSSFARMMWPASLSALLFAALVLIVRPGDLVVAGPILLLWFLSPLIACGISQPRTNRNAPLEAAEQAELRKVARKTWGFFEAFVNADGNWLPPDNYQEQPRPRIAFRTSPTNKGLYLVSALAAHDLGYLSLSALIARLEKTFDTLEKLERVRGHFLNWYDTRNLNPLTPAYISTVDSGNFLGGLITLKHGLLERMRAPLIGPAVLAGFADTLAVLSDVVAKVRRPASTEADALFTQIGATLKVLRDDLESPVKVPMALGEWLEWLGHLEHKSAGLQTQLRQLTALAPATAVELEIWGQRWLDQIHDRRTELEAIAPWAHDSAQELAALVNGEETLKQLTDVRSLTETEEAKEALLLQLEQLAQQTAADGTRSGKLLQLREKVRASAAGGWLTRCQRLVARSEALAEPMDFRFLYKADRKLFTIGYQVATQKLDEACYDLLASEARLASFLAVARGEAPPAHWFHLGRLLTKAGNEPCLVSWGGTMFEYLMPRLFLRIPLETLLSQSCEAAVDAQIAYGKARAVPWGISESAFSGQYASSDYQYQSFGVPGLGLKRGLGQDLVIAPYACALAVGIRPHEALSNFRFLSTEGAAGPYGFYEAIDYTRSRLPEGRRSLVVRCFMAHHQGMSLVALANCLLDDVMVRRFHAEPMVRATDLLLQEKPARSVVPVVTEEPEVPSLPATEEAPSLLTRRLTTPDTPTPRTHLLSNGQYTVMVTNAGSGFSRCEGIDVTRWRDDGTCDASGPFFYVRDLTTGRFWSAGHQPVCRETSQYEVRYSADKAEFRRVDGTIATQMEVVVSPESNAEVRRMLLHNRGTHPVDLEVTSYCELALANHAADRSHPAFSKLFLETEWLPGHHALLCHRRPRSPGETPLWAVHVAAPDGHTLGEPEYETDRGRFVGRGRTLAAPSALTPGAALSGTVGPVLDPIFSLRWRVRLAPGATSTLIFTTAMVHSRDAALSFADHYRSAQAGLHVFDLAWAHVQVELRHLQITSTEAHLLQRLASPLLYCGPAHRHVAPIPADHKPLPSGIGRFGLSDDRPILLARISTVDEMPLVRQLLVAHAYWRLKGLIVDLVLFCDKPGGYLDPVFHELQEAVRTSDAHDLLEKPGGIHLVKSETLSPDEWRLLEAAARVVLAGTRGTLAEQLETVGPAPALPANFVATASASDRPQPSEPVALPKGLLFTNGLGGFRPDGREYCVLPYRADAHGHWEMHSPPAPWINVIANPVCGFMVSESTLGMTWMGNSQLCRLTPWSNDPVVDPASEVLYLRDEETGAVWTPTPQPLGTTIPTLVNHGQGYTRFEQNHGGLQQELLLFVPSADPVKILRLRVKNTGKVERHLSATFYAEWVLGGTREQCAPHVQTAVDADSGALLAWNPFTEDLPNLVAFADVNCRPRTVTGDRSEFLGRNHGIQSPAALQRAELSGRTGPALDPCAALQTHGRLKPGQTWEVVFLLGAAGDVANVRKLIQQYHTSDQVEAAFVQATAFWDHALSAVHVETPDAGLNLMLNRWLIYQVLSCRLWGRSAFYQSGGAYGFRDQLQDIMALVYSLPQEARAHILRAASRQFAEGDVQHWWHPPAGRGVRTHISDDYLWLPFVVSHYVNVTGERAILDEPIQFLCAPVLTPGQPDDYRLPDTDGTDSLYEHCVRALDHVPQFGSHGLPLIGTGDWNDGMNTVGEQGRGESVWLAWFLLTCLQRFADLAQTRGDSPHAARWRERAELLRQAIEAEAWDDAWYRRAYFDDGTPLGSQENRECQIDSIAQSWAVLSGAGAAERCRQAMAAVEQRLVRNADGLILLFAPPFDGSGLQPGYVQGYVPGIRENGGQYTHAATWVVQATAMLGEGSRAVALWNMLNPITHTKTPEEVERYRVEPYVIPGDVYGISPHVGRGGWTWYTGAAAWLYRVALESILGWQLRGTRLAIRPCIPGNWPTFRVTFRYGSATYRATIENPDGIESGNQSVTLDGTSVSTGWIQLTDDGAQHDIVVRLQK